MAIRKTNTSEVTASNAYVLIAGESGIGKTTLAKTLKGKTLIVSAESGLLSLKDTNIDVWELDTFADFREAMTALSETDYDNIYIDSLTEIMELLVDEAKTQFEGFKLWGHYTETAIKVLKFLRDLKGFNVYFTCLTKQEKDGLHMVDKFDFSGSKIQDKIKSYFDEVIHYKTIEFEGEKTRVLVTDSLESPLAKDRSGRLNKYEKPDLGALTEKVLS